MSSSIAVKKLEEATVYDEDFITMFEGGFWIHSNKATALKIDRQEKELMFPDGSICFVNKNGKFYIFNADPATYIQILWKPAGIAKIVGKFPTPGEAPIIL